MTHGSCTFRGEDSNSMTHNPCTFRGEDSCLGVDFWTVLKHVEANLRGHLHLPAADAVESTSTHTGVAEVKLTPRELRHMARSPRLHADESLHGLANQWNALSEGPLTARLQSIEDFEHLWGHGGLAEAASEHGNWAKHQQHRLDRTPTFDESLQWFTKRYSVGGKHVDTNRHAPRCKDAVPCAIECSKTNEVESRRVRQIC